MQPIVTAPTTSPGAADLLVPLPTQAGQATLAAARTLGRKAAAPATLRAYKTDRTKGLIGYGFFLQGGQVEDILRGTSQPRWTRRTALSGSTVQARTAS
jgi:hypothetical protein